MLALPVHRQGFFHLPFYGWFVVLCALGAMARVFLFSAALPFFAVTDEPYHYDTIYKYAQGFWPRGLAFVSPGAAWNATLFRSYEVMNPPQKATFYTRPRWSQPTVTLTRDFQADVQSLTQTVNIESGQPPLYYWLAGKWYRLGYMWGLRGGALLYWLRFLQVPLAALLVCAGALLARQCFPERVWVQWGVPLFLAVYPQDIFYSLNNDTLSPLLCAAALSSALAARSRGGLAWYGLTGLLTSLALLTKLPNVVLFVGIAALLLTGRHPPRPGAALFLFFAVAPFSMWALGNWTEDGDWLNSRDKVAALTWTVKPWPELWNHPLFHSPALFNMVRETIGTLWTGEGMYYGRNLAGSGLRSAYAVGWCVLAGAALYSARRQGAQDEGRMDLLLALQVLLGLGLLLALSIRWDFGTCVYPSREHPFFSSGRLILGCMVPALIVAVRGLDLITTRWRPCYKATVFAALALLITTTHTLPLLQAFPSRFNWFHLATPPDPNVLTAP